VRNRIRRRLRAVLAELTPRLGAGGYLVGAGREAASAPYEELKHMVEDALDALQQRHPA
jgi:ribonuclease P protein component